MVPPGRNSSEPVKCFLLSLGRNTLVVPSGCHRESPLGFFFFGGSKNGLTGLELVSEGKDRWMS